MNFFDRVRIEVKQNNTTIEDLLASVFNEEVSRSTYNTWKRRGTLPRANQAVSIANALGVTVEYLVTGQDSSGFPERIRRLAKKMMALSESDLSAIEAMVDVKTIHQSGGGHEKLA